MSYQHSQEHPPKVLIAIGKDSPWCRAVFPDPDSGLPVRKTTGKLMIDSAGKTLGAYLIHLLLSGYTLKLVDLEEQGMGKNVAIDGMHEDYIRHLIETDPAYTQMKDAMEEARAQDEGQADGD